MNFICLYGIVTDWTLIGFFVTRIPSLTNIYKRKFCHFSPKFVLRTAQRQALAASGRDWAEKPPDTESARLPRVLGGVGADSPKVRRNACTACPDAPTGSGARGVGQVLQDDFELWFLRFTFIGIVISCWHPKIGRPPYGSACATWSWPPGRALWPATTTGIGKTRSVRLV